MERTLPIVQLDFSPGDAFEEELRDLGSDSDAALAGESGVAGSGKSCWGSRARHAGDHRQPGDLPEPALSTAERPQRSWGRPYNRDSGKFRGSRRCWGGRAHVRVALYMATGRDQGCDSTPTLKEFYEQSQEGGAQLRACGSSLTMSFQGITPHGTRKSSLDAQDSWGAFSPQETFA